MFKVFSTALPSTIPRLRVMRIDVEIRLIFAIRSPPFVPDTINSAQEGLKIQTAKKEYLKKVFLGGLFREEISISLREQKSRR